MRHFVEHQKVQVRGSWPEQQLLDRAIGTIVMVYADPKGYEVEFVNSEGEFPRLVSLSEEEAQTHLAPSFESVKRHVFKRHDEVFRRLSRK